MVSPLQQEVFLTIGTIGISFLEEQQDAVSVANSSFVDAMEEFLQQFVCFSLSFLSVISVLSFLR
ncbi:hypothetical protein BTJ44_05475 [Bacillus mycoides]|nr:hypothetical protein BTJ44_05475 [Bacillus mycoides]